MVRRYDKPGKLMSRTFLHENCLPDERFTNVVNAGREIRARALVCLFRTRTSVFGVALEGLARCRRVEEHTASRNQTPMNRQAASASICVQVYVIGVAKTAAKFVYRHSPMQNLSVLVRDGTCTSSRISNPVTPSATMWLL